MGDDGERGEWAPVRGGFKAADRVYDIVARIPPGRVTTFGDIARAIGSVRGARMVGWILQYVPDELDLPCHRVVNRYGYLSGGWHFGHPDVMRDRLLAEGVPFSDDFTVDIDAVRWLPWEDEPEALPSAAADKMDDFDLVAGADDGGVE